MAEKQTINILNNQIYRGYSSYELEQLDIENSFVVNIGNMMAMWTNDCYQSTLYRVLNTGHDRLSMPFFTEPHLDQIIHVCLDVLITKTHLNIPLLRVEIGW